MEKTRREGVGDIALPSHKPVDICASIAIVIDLLQAAQIVDQNL